MHLFKRLANTLPVSLYMLARYAEEVQADPETAVGEMVRSIYAEIYEKYLEDDQLIAICERLQEYGLKVQEAANKAKPPAESAAAAKHRDKYFSEYFNTFMDSLDVSKSMMWLTEFDATKARNLYMYEDFEVVEAMLETKRGLENERNRLLYEAALFGFGGGYSKGSGKAKDEGDVIVHDLSKVPPNQMIARINAAQQRR